MSCRLFRSLQQLPTTIRKSAQLGLQRHLSFKEFLWQRSRAQLPAPTRRGLQLPRTSAPWESDTSNFSRDLDSCAYTPTQTPTEKHIIKNNFLKKVCSSQHREVVMCTVPVLLQGYHPFLLCSSQSHETSPLLKHLILSSKFSTMLFALHYSICSFKDALPDLASVQAAAAHHYHTPSSLSVYNSSLFSIHGDYSSPPMKS